MDNPIESFEFYNFYPPSSQNCNEPGAEFQINVYSENIITQPSKSLLILNGFLTIKKTTVNAAGGVIVTDEEEVDYDDVHFVNNGPLHLFDRIDYYIGDMKIDSIRKPGYATTIKGLVSFQCDLNYNQAGWKIHSNSHTNILNKRKFFSVTIPLSLVMGFFEDYKNLLYHVPQKLVFYKSTASKPLNCFELTHAYSVEVTLNEVVWRVPQIKFSIEYETKINKEILNNTMYSLDFRHWFYHSIIPPIGSDFTWDFPIAYSKTKYMLIGFQTNRDNIKERDNSNFDLVDLENVEVSLNDSPSYPRTRLNLKYNELKCGNLYYMFNQFKSSYYSDSMETVNKPLVDYDTFLNQYPIIAIDMSHQPNVIKNSLINIRIHFNWHNNIPPNLTIHCIMIMDKMVRYNPLTKRIIGQQAI